uniref:Uncharacterized protein n=1 Tax=Anguilla anguilla TaxID=7936 RepID=A0A0E9TEX9_ANGAN
MTAGYTGNAFFCQLVSTSSAQLNAPPLIPLSLCFSCRSGSRRGAW